MKCEVCESATVQEPECDNWKVGDPFEGEMTESWYLEEVKDTGFCLFREFIPVTGR